MRTIRWIFPALLALAAIAAGCSPATPQTADLPRLISPQDAAARLAEDENAVLLDVRTPEEWATDGRSPDAILIPLQELEARLDELDRNGTIMVICRSGNRSRPAAELLRQAGFSRVTEVEGGMRNWAGQGLPVECDVAVCALAP